MKIVSICSAALLIGLMASGCKMDSEKTPGNTSTSGASMGTTPGGDTQMQNGGMNNGTTNSGNAAGTMSTSAPMMR